MIELESDRISEALVQALETGDTKKLFDRIERSSGLPGKRPNLPLLRAVAGRLATAGKAGDALIDEMFVQTHPALYRVAYFALALRVTSKGGGGRSFERLHDAAEEPTHEHREALIDALTDVAVHGGDKIAERFVAFTDGFLHAHVALEVLTRGEVLSRLARPEPILERFTEAFDLADASSRADDRSQGLRLLRASMPAQIARVAPRFGEIVDWVRERTTRERPESRQIIIEAISALRKIVGEAEATRLREAHLVSRPKLYSDHRIIYETRRRSRGKK